MIKVQTKLTNFDIDQVGYTKALFDAIEVQMRQAARAFLKAIIASGRVPVYSGTARGSLIPLGQLLNRTIPIRPTAKARKRKDFGIKNGQEIGASLGHAEIIRGNITEFIYTTSVPYFEINENSDPRPAIHLTHEPIPWKAFPEGRKALNKYLDENFLKRVPHLTKYTKRTTIRVI